jgi:hypothetical protein
MALNRPKDFASKIRVSIAQFYVLRKRAEDDPLRIPEPDGYLLHDCTSPVWRDQTVDAYIERVLEHSQAEHAARRPSPAVATA